MNRDVPIFKIDETEVFPNGKATYDSSVFDLEYLSFIHEFVLAEQKHSLLVIYDTLTICFDFLDRRFVSFDAYTNSSLWKKTTESFLPKSYGNGILKLAAGLYSDDRYSFPYIPEYILSDKGELRIRLSKKNTNNYFQISKGLFAGLHNESLCDLLITDLNF